MSRTQRQRIGILAVSILAITPALWAGDPHGRPGLEGIPATGVSGLDSAAQVWRAVLGYWIPLDRAPEYARHLSRGRGSGLLPTCDNGPLIDPDGRCVKSVPPLGPSKACDNGALIDPSGGACSPR
jgi:hypothetical protein